MAFVQLSQFTRSYGDFILLSHFSGNSRFPHISTVWTLTWVHFYQSQFINVVDTISAFTLVVESADWSETITQLWQNYKLRLLGRSEKHWKTPENILRCLKYFAFVMNEQNMQKTSIMVQERLVLSAHTCLKQLKCFAYYNWS